MRTTSSGPGYQGWSTSDSPTSECQVTTVLQQPVPGRRRRRTHRLSVGLSRAGAVAGPGTLTATVQHPGAAVDLPSQVCSTCCGTSDRNQERRHPPGPARGRFMLGSMREPSPSTPEEQLHFFRSLRRLRDEGSVVSGPGVVAWEGYATLSRSYRMARAWPRSTRRRCQPEGQSTSEAPDSLPTSPG